MKILYLTKQVRHLENANYQYEVIRALENNSEVHLTTYGPGMIHYQNSDSITQILEKLEFNPDVIILGHSWLGDQEGVSVDPHPALDLMNCSIPKVAILNKEYINLKAKLQFIREQKIQLAFTHHHDAEVYANSTNVPFHFWPFAVDESYFVKEPLSLIRYYDSAFCGIMQNQNKNANQSNVRVQIQKLFYYVWLDIGFWPKPNFSNRKIYWNGRPRTRWKQKLAKILGKYRYLSNQEYKNLLLNSKTFINSPSPMGLISPRIFECMACGTLVFCEDSPQLSKIFTKPVYATYKSDLSDFNEKMSYYLTHQEERKNLTAQALQEVQTRHTWQIRVKTLIKEIKAI